jgi:hypothetical protein
MSDNEKLYERAVDAINDLFSDKSVSQSTCRDNLLSLIDEIKTMLDSLD